jgi:type I restriction enzyme S subunit
MSEENDSLLTGDEMITRPLSSMVLIDPESLPLGTHYDFQFHYFDISSVANGRLQIPDLPTNYAEAPSRARRVVKNGDVLMSTVRPNLKAFAYCDLSEGNYIASTGFAVLRVIEGNDPRYILYSILSDDVTRQIDSHVVGSSYPAINSSDVKRLRIPDWKPSQQRCIAKILSSLDEAIEQTEVLIAKHQKIKAGLMHDLLTRGVTPDGHLRPPRGQAPNLYKESPLGWVPKDWVVGMVEDVIAGIEQGWSPDCEADSAGIQEWGVLKTSSVVWGGFDRTENKKLPSHLLPRFDLMINKGDVLMTRAGPNSRVGVVALVDIEPGQLMLSDKIYRLVPAAGLSSEFLTIALSSAATQRDLDSFKTGLAESQTNISQAIVRRLSLPIPQKNERDMICERISVVTDQIRITGVHHEKLQKLKQGLMHDLLTGRVRVQQKGYLWNSMN